jgi:hypothetical protein
LTAAPPFAVKLSASKRATGTRKNAIITTTPGASSAGRPETMRRHGVLVDSVTLASAYAPGVELFGRDLGVLAPPRGVEQHELPCCCGPPDRMLARSGGIALNAAGTTVPYV